MFRVEWLQDALDELTRLWMQADSALRQAITAATHAIDQELQVDPYRQSESREDDERVLFVYPLAVLEDFPGIEGRQGDGLDGAELSRSQSGEREAGESIPLDLACESARAFAGAGLRRCSDEFGHRKTSR